MNDYNWTTSDLEQELSLADALELAGVADIDGESCERVDDAEHADFFSVYVHYDVTKSDNRGASCIADRPTYDAALAFAQELSDRTGLSLLNLT